MIVDPTDFQLVLLIVLGSVSRIVIVNLALDFPHGLDILRVQISINRSRKPTHQKVTLEAIDKPDLNAACHMDVLKAGLEHEKYVTSLINDIYSEAYEAKDFRTMQFLDWFVKEQGEEETNAKNLISKIELFGSDPKSLYMLNQELAARVYSAPSLVL